MNFQHKLTIESVTGHAEKAGQELGDVGVSVKLVGEVKLQDLAPLIGCDHTAQILDHLYDAKGTPHTENFDSAALKVEHNDIEATVSIGGQQKKFRDAVVDSIVLTPSINRVIGVALRLKVHPTEGQGGWLLMNLKRDVICDLRGGKTTIAAKTAKDDRQPSLDLKPKHGEKKVIKPAAGKKNGKAPVAAAA